MTISLDYDHVIEIIIAMKEGKQIEVEQYQNVWVNLKKGDCPNFKYSRYYRIKKENQQYKSALMRKYGDGDKCYVVSVTNIDSATNVENSNNFIKWLSDWIEFNEE